MSVEQYLQAILDELRIKPKGQVWPATVTVPNKAVLTIDFEDSTTKLSTPDPTFTQNIQIPQEKLFSVTITNDGPFPIQYSTNKPLNSGDAAATLNAGNGTQLNFEKPVITRINLIALGGQSIVRIVGLI